MKAPFVLLVDDETSFVNATAKRLEIRDIEVLSAFSGEECLEILKANENLEVIVLDVKMPEMDGIETLKEIKKVFPLIQVIMLTGNATIESAIEGMKLGAFDYLIKPCKIEKLVDKVREAAKHKREHQEKMEEAAKRETLAKYGPFYYA
jgi:DNA-binding NtrC family response regulator